MRKATRLVEQLSAEAESDPAASSRRIKAAQERAAREREAKVNAALARLGELEEERKRRGRTNKKDVAKQGEPRASTTDPQTRVMKMADGGYRAAYQLPDQHRRQAGQIVVAAYAETRWLRPRAHAADA